VHQRCRLERMPRLFAAQIAARQAPQFAVDQRGQRLKRRLAAVGPLLKEPRDFVWRSHWEEYTTPLLAWCRRAGFFLR